MGGRKGRCAALAGALAGVVIQAPAGHAAPAHDVSCAALAAGTTGLPEFALGPTLDLVTDRSGHASPRVDLRTTTATFNSTYEFATRDGGIVFRNRASPDDWRALPLPPCFAGHVRAVSADGPYVVAADDSRRIFTMDNADKNPLTWSWTSRWGPPLWVNPAGQRLPKDTLTWQLSVLSSVEDKTWTDPAGNDQTVGGGNVTTIYALRSDHRRITLLDPWLPDDYSYEVCGPRQGRLELQALAASGSTLFVADRFGDLYTRLWDFDISGADDVFFRYSYADQRGARRPIVPVPNYVPTGIPGLQTPPIQLPAPGWVAQPKIPGPITDTLSISKTGPGSSARELRVAGRDTAGNGGYWHKPIGGATWAFARTDRAPAGRPLDNTPSDRTSDALGPPDGGFYQSADGAITVPSFKAACTPATLRRGGESLILHTVDALRQNPRAEGLDSTPREQLATIEDHGHFMATDLQATVKTLSFPKLGWKLIRVQPFFDTRVREDRSHRITVTTNVRSDGVLTARAPGYRTRRMRLRRAGRAALRLGPPHHRRKNVRVTITFTPTGGDPKAVLRVLSGDS